jgi:hypothetical protein
MTRGASGMHGWLVNGALGTLHAGCRHVLQGELDCADFAGAQCLLVLPLRDALPDVTVLPCWNRMRFHRRPHGVELVGHRGCGPPLRCRSVHPSLSAAGSTSTLFLRQNQLWDRWVGSKLQREFGDLTKDAIEFEYSCRFVCVRVVWCGVRV